MISTVFDSSAVWRIASDDCKCALSARSRTRFDDRRYDKAGSSLLKRWRTKNKLKVIKHYHIHDTHYRQIESAHLSTNRFRTWGNSFRPYCLHFLFECYKCISCAQKSSQQDINRNIDYFHQQVVWDFYTWTFHNYCRRGPTRLCLNLPYQRF